MTWWDTLLWHVEVFYNSCWYTFLLTSKFKSPRLTFIHNNWYHQTIDQIDNKDRGEMPVINSKNNGDVPYPQIIYN